MADLTGHEFSGGEMKLKIEDHMHSRLADIGTNATISGLVTTAGSYGVSLTVPASQMTIPEVCAIVGAIVAVLGFIFSAYHNYRMRQIAMANLKGGRK